MPFGFKYFRSKPEQSLKKDKSNINAVLLNKKLTSYSFIFCEPQRKEPA